MDQSEEATRTCWRRLDFLVVQDMYHTTETARMADLVLPAAGWGEKDGTFINSERRIGLVKKVARAPGQALADFSIFRLIAETWGCGEMFAKWQSPEAVFDLLKELSRGQPCDISGIRNYRMIDECGGIQWPLSEAEARERFDQQRRLFGDGRFFTADQRAVFHFAELQPDPESLDADFPLRLLTGRGSSAQWHTQTRTAKSALLRKLYPARAYAEIHPEDARELGVGAGHRVRIVSRYGAVEVTVYITPTIARGQVFLPMHYGETNQLTAPVFDPISRQPSYKSTAVRVEAVGAR